jgi:hypothetical protein
VLDGGGWLDPLDEEPPELPPLDPPPDPPDDDELLGGGHGCTATVWVIVPCGTTIWFEPGGIFELPDCATVASEHGGTAMVRSLCCLGITTVRTPGVCSAVLTASCCDFELLPHAASAMPATTTNATVPALPMLAPSSAAPLVDGPYPQGVAT